MPDTPEYGEVSRVLTSCDVQHYAGRSFAEQFDVQERIVEFQDSAAEHARVPRRGDFIQHAGDGDLTRWPAGTTPVDVLARYVPALHSELKRANRHRAPECAIKMRLAVAMGTSRRTSSGGLVGTAVETVSRLVDSREAKDALLGAGDAPLLVIVEDAVYRDVVAKGMGYLDPAEYRLVEVRNKEFAQRAWITVPGRQLPPGNGSEPPDADHRPGKPGRRWWRISVTISAAIITGGATVVAAVIMSSGNLGRTQQSTGTPAASSSAQAASSSSTPTRPPSTSPAGRWTEVAANRRGVPTFADTSGAAASAGSIPYGTAVEVSCVAPNISGMSSVNAFYRIETAPWQGLYAPANTFANGDPLGSSGTHDIDPAVPKC
ncbi:hypothetical protein SAMN04489727_7362 [Amycolatopsis tolypomycina]|uniref:Uncharacterized protein n=1 Tax=Amycolatopsis tolypomycina TaxID=208445 RepID=A0A1H4ZPB9_9PSEU|nr:hypothetical protein [Amycolatopsis tolypomycina]SED31314.1 hypothetical protein SAMN04489727_7362 [Amycolatopsis tolypomycina]